MAKKGVIGMPVIAVGCLAIYLVMPRLVGAHCDTMDGPVVKTAKVALEKGDVTPVLKWVKKDDEPAIKEAFKRTLAVRSKGAEAKELADMYFFETLVRIHRAGEGAAYEGLKPAGTEIEPPVASADRALESGSVDETITMIRGVMTEGIRHRFAKAVEKKKHMDESVEAGREYVEAYVDFVHYIEGIYVTATKSGLSHSAESEKVN